MIKDQENDLLKPRNLLLVETQRVPKFSIRWMYMSIGTKL